PPPLSGPTYPPPSGAPGAYLPPAYLGGPMAMGGLKPHRATLILVLGIVGILCCAPLGIFALVLGTQDLAEMDAGRMDPSGRPLTNVGRIIGIVAIVSMVVQVIWFFANVS
ncbi:MAG: DUF4190 domain-containing protein, partial [Candidatus Nanopelagicales bacterium]